MLRSRPSWRAALRAARGCRRPQRRLRVTLARGEPALIAWRRRARPKTPPLFYNARLTRRWHGLDLLESGKRERRPVVEVVHGRTVAEPHQALAVAREVGDVVRRALAARQVHNVIVGRVAQN